MSHFMRPNTPPVSVYCNDNYRSTEEEEYFYEKRLNRISVCYLPEKERPENLASAGTEQ